MPSLDPRLAERLAKEALNLRQTFPNATIDADALVVVLSDHALPPGWSHEQSDILVVIPVNYPGGQPDNVCARCDLALADGRTPANNQGIHSYAGRRWLQLSYHIDPSDWRPTSDPSVGSNLAEYLTGALSRFDELS